LLTGQVQVPPEHLVEIHLLHLDVRLEDLHALGVRYSFEGGFHHFGKSFDEDFLHKLVEELQVIFVVDVDILEADPLRYSSAYCMLSASVANASSGSIIQNSARCREVREFSTLNVGLNYAAEVLHAQLARHCQEARFVEKVALVVYESFLEEDGFGRLHLLLVQFLRLFSLYFFLSSLLGALGFLLVLFLLF